MRIFGGILPFIGFRKVTILDYEGQEDGEEHEMFVMEWFNRGFGWHIERVEE